jgi:DNA-binding transcriptional LysR family regulator
LIAKKIKEVPARLYATPEYLARLGNPATKAALNKADFIGLMSTTRLIAGLNELGFNLAPDNFPIQTQSHIVHWEMVKQGLGIGIMPADIGDREPLVRQALPGLKPIMFPIWLTCHRELKTSRRVRLVFDLLAAELA